MLGFEEKLSVEIGKLSKTNFTSIVSMSRMWICPTCSLHNTLSTSHPIPPTPTTSILVLTSQLWVPLSKLAILLGCGVFMVSIYILQILTV